MNDTSTVARLIRNAGRWAVLGTAFAMFSVAASSCKKDDEDGDGNGASAGAGNDGAEGGDSGSSSDGGAGSGEDEDPFGDLREACPDISEDLAECGTSGKASKQLKVNMLVVLDRSGSMDQVPDGYNESLWLSVSSALKTVLGDASSRIDFALELYPNSGDPDNPVPKDCEEEKCCVMPQGTEMDVPFDEDETAITASDDDDPAIDKIIAKLEDTDPGGGTPTAEALRRARIYLQNAGLSGNTYVLLATDGGPNCNSSASCGIADCTMHIDGKCMDESNPTINCCEPVQIGCVDSDDTLDAIKGLADDGVSTYVVGIPGSEPYEPYLNEFAEAGGVASESTETSYYRVSVDGGSDALARTFREITEQLVTSCKIELAEPPPDPQRVNVAINCNLVPRIDSNEEPQWEFNDDNTVITILGDECVDIEEEGAQRVDVLQDCPPVGVF